MSDLGQAASKIGEKIVDILDVFDLSFFISGAMGIGAALVAFPDALLPLLGAQPDPETGLGGGETPGAVLFGLVLGSYVVGLVCFSIGRPLRELLGRATPRAFGLAPSYELFGRALTEHFRHQPDETKTAFRSSFGYDVETGGRDAYTQAYTRMWAHVRSYPQLSESFSLLKRYWILAASYDGIATAVLLWLVPVWRHRPGDGDLPSVVVTLALLTASVFCMFRARLYKRYQIEELVATVVHWMIHVGRPQAVQLDKDLVELRKLELELGRLGEGGAEGRAPTPAPAPDPAARPES